MTRSLLCLLAGLVLGFLLAVATKARAFNRLSAANRELASQLESEEHQLEAEKHQLELQKQLTEAATASIRLATGQLNECNQALHRATTRLRSQ
jgi:peptidoglycan hydrolase CwlO-like protein